MRDHFDLQDIASFLNVTAKTISKTRKNITFGKDLPQNSQILFTWVKTFTLGTRFSGLPRVYLCAFL